MTEIISAAAARAELQSSVEKQTEVCLDIFNRNVLAAARRNCYHCHIRKSDYDYIKDKVLAAGYNASEIDNTEAIYISWYPPKE
jgi:hypothetical protein